MTELARLLEVRKRIKAKKPQFLMQDHYRRKELPKRWRRPRGMHSKMRMRKAGHPKHVEIGWGSPKEVKGLNKKGMMPILVSNATGLEIIDAKTMVAVVRHGVGIRKRLEIAKAAAAKGITVSNAKEEKLTRKIEERKAAKAKRGEEKKAVENKKEAKRTKPEEAAKKKKETVETQETKEEAEKKEKDKLLIKRT